MSLYEYSRCISVSLHPHNNNYVSIIRNERNNPDGNSINTETCDIIFLSWTFCFSAYSVNINYVWWTYAKSQSLCLKIVCNRITAFKFCTFVYATNCFINVSNLFILKFLKSTKQGTAKPHFLTRHRLLCTWQNIFC